MNDETILEDLIDRDQYATDQLHDIFEQAKVDQRFRAGDPWNPDDKIKRQQAGRPCLSLDELSQYENQVINDWRANPRGMKFSPIGNGATDESARFYTDKAREIEYRSNAQIAYAAALSNCVGQSIGWFRFYTEHEHIRSQHQELCIGAIPNPLMVKWDPDAQSPDSSDMKYLIYGEKWKIKEFVRTFGKDAKITSFGPEEQKSAPNWVDADTITLAEYWVKEAYKRKLLVIGKPGVRQTINVFEDELGKKLPQGIPEGYDNIYSDERDDARVQMYLTNGIEILKKSDWKGKYIPFVSCFGKVLYVDEGTGAKRKILSMTRLARDPYMAYCFLRTCQIELIGMTTKNPYWAYAGQLTPEQLVDIQKSLHEPVAVLLANASLPELPNQLIPLPQRNQFAVEMQNYAAFAEELRRSIQAAMGIAPLPTEAQKQNQKSGVALKRIESAGQRGAYHFTDAGELMIRMGGVIYEDLCDKVYDGTRQTGIRDAQGNSSSVWINDPTNPNAISTQGDHLVTVSAGPSFDSEREAASDFADTLAQNPQIFALLGPLIVKLKNLGPIGDEIAETLEVLQPPELRMQKQAKEMDPKQLASQLAQASMKVKQLEQQLQQAGFIIHTKQVEGQTKYQIEQMKVQATSADKAADREVKLAIAELGARVERLALFLEESRLVGARQHDALERGRDRAHEVIQGAKDRAHDAAKSALEHTQAQELADQAHGHALEQGDQGIQGQLTTQEQAASLAPQPESGE